MNMQSGIKPQSSSIHHDNRYRTGVEKQKKEIATTHT